MDLGECIALLVFLLLLMAGDLRRSWANRRYRQARRDGLERRR